ncbi:MAG: N-acetyltransferase [Bryobacteraceae bacterium]
MIREETSVIHSAIRQIHEAAFKRADEADLVDRLRANGAILLSLVAELEGEAAGSVIFSRMTIETPSACIDAVALAPVAVLPEHQRTGVGSELIRSGLDILRQRGERIVIVLGHPEYYPRFGFSVEAAAALDSPFPRHAFMALELVPGALDGVRGRVRYPPAFGL